MEEKKKEADQREEKDQKEETERFKEKTSASKKKRSPKKLAEEEGLPSLRSKRVKHIARKSASRL